MSVASDHFAEVVASNAVALAAAEQEAPVSGKQVFSVEPLEALYSKSTLAEREPGLRLMYYVSHPEVRTMAQFVARLTEMEKYE